MPERNIPNNQDLFMSPANGVIGSIQYWNSDTINILKEKYGVIKTWTKDVDTAGWMISIVMDPTNVHFQRCPLDAEILTEHYQEGSFNNAVANENPFNIRFENEHNEILFRSTRNYIFKTIQISGFVARRIEDYVTPGQKLKQGDVYGLIKLGSQVTVILPHNFTPKVKVGEIVTDGETVLAQ